MDLIYDLYFLILLESGEILHFNGAWIGTSLAYKKAMLNMIDLAHKMESESKKDEAKK